MIKASVIIPTYKRPKETLKCIEYLLQSNYLNEKFTLEFIVIDSSSDQATKRLLVNNLNIKLKYIYKKNRLLPGAARNLAVRKAKNELIISVDSDIEVKPDTLWNMIKYLKDHPKAARITGTTIFSSGQNHGNVDRPSKWDRFYQKDDTFFIEGIYGRYEAFYKTPFLKIGGYDEIFEFCGEGTDLSVRYWRAGFPLAFSKETSAFHDSEASGSLRRLDSGRMTQMYRSLFLVAYKYGVNDIQLSPNFVKSHEERQEAYGNTTEFYSIVSGGESIDWFSHNIKRIQSSKKRIPRKFDFKPFDVFSNAEILNHCLSEAESLLSVYYKKVFRN